MNCGKRKNELFILLVVVYQIYFIIVFTTPNYKLDQDSVQSQVFATFPNNFKHREVDIHYMS